MPDVWGGEEAVGFFPVLKGQCHEIFDPQFFS